MKIYIENFKPNQAFAPAECDDWSLVNGVPKVKLCGPQII